MHQILAIFDFIFRVITIGLVILNIPIWCAWLYFRRQDKKAKQIAQQKITAQRFVRHRTPPLNADTHPSRS
jgi:hypothetical protein